MRSGGLSLVLKMLIGFCLGSVLLLLLFTIHDYSTAETHLSWNEVLLVVLFGGIAGLLVSLLLIANIKQTRKLRDSEKKYQTLIDQSLDGIYIEDERGNILECNVQGYKMFGYTKEEMLKLSLRDLVPPEFSKLLPDVIPDEMETGDVYLERENIKKDGTIFPTEINTKFITLNGERRLLAYVKDNTEKKKAEQALKESEGNLKALNAAKDKILSIIAHDLKNQFGAILGFSEMIADEAEHHQLTTLNDYANEINLAASQANSLLENMLSWAMMQKKMASFKPMALCLSELVDKVCDTLRGTANIKKIQLQNRVLADLKVYADGDMMLTVLRNLLSNAIKFTSRNGLVEILSDGPGELGEVVIEVRDNGVGIAPEKIAKLFRPGEYQSTLGTEQEIGTGLGLAVCQEFIEKHGGRIWVESELGKGSSFFMKLPTCKD